MKKTIKTPVSTRKLANDTIGRNEIKERLLFSATNDSGLVYERLGATAYGLSCEQVKIARESYGDNTVTHGKTDSLLKRICNAFAKPNNSEPHMARLGFQ